MRTIVDDVVDEGHQERVWNGKDSDGNSVSSGVYFCRLSAGERMLAKKMVVLR